VKLQLHLITQKGKPVFLLSAKSARKLSAPSRQTGFRGWADLKLRKFKEAFANSNRGATGVFRRFWDKLQSRMPSDEKMLSQLRKVDAIEIMRPESISEEEARAQWNEYLSGCRRRHLPWFCLNALIAPVSLLLAALPGPNLIGYWFGYRAIKDLLALLGIRHARSLETATTFPIETDFSRAIGLGTPETQSQRPPTLTADLPRTPLAGGYSSSI